MDNININNIKLQEFFNFGERSAKIILIGENLGESLIANQLDFFAISVEDFAENHKNLSEEIELIIIEPEYLNKINPKDLEYLNNIKIFTYMKTGFTNILKKFMTIKSEKSENFRIAKDENNLIMQLISAINPDIFLRRPADLIYMKRIKKDENIIIYIFANGGENHISTECEIYLNNLENNYKLSEYDFASDNFVEINNCEVKNSRAILEIEIESGDYKIVRLEKI